MTFTKEGWWEHLRDTDLKDLPDDPEILELVKQVFYSGYVCKEAEQQIIADNISLLKTIANYSEV